MRGHETQRQVQWVRSVPCLDEVLYEYDSKLSHEGLTMTVCYNITFEIIVHLGADGFMEYNKWMNEWIKEYTYKTFRNFFISLHTDLSKFSIATDALQNENHMGQL